MEIYKNDMGVYPGQDVGLSSCYSEYCVYSFDGFSDLENQLSPYLSNIKFINSSFYVENFDAYYQFDIPVWTGANNGYSCDGTETYTEYIFGFPIYDKSGREINMPFPKDTEGGFYGSDFYCIGV